MSTHPLRVALVVGDEHLPAWQCRMLEHLRTNPALTLVALIVAQPTKLSAWRRWSQSLFDGLRVLEGKLFKYPLTVRSRGAMAHHRQPFLHLLGDLPMYVLGGQRYHALLQTTPVEVAIDLSGQAPSGALAAWPREGLWRHFYGDAAAVTDHGAGVCEYISKQAEIVSGIERLTAAPTGPQRFFYATTSTDGLSMNRGVERLLWKMADFIPQRLHELATVGAAPFWAGIQRRDFRTLPAVACPCVLGGKALLKLLWRYALNLASKLANVLCYCEQWVLLVGQRSDVTDAQTLASTHKLMPSRDRFWADPFIIEHDRETYVFFEEMIYSHERGHLSYLKLNADGSHSKPERILEKPYHLSYPFIFEYQGQYYLIPETADNGTLELYRCAQFPNRWVFDRYLMEGVNAYDATLVEHQGRWWMFVSMNNHPSCSPNESLYLFHADNPLSTQWQPHPQNPVVTRAASARPGGRLFRDGGQLYRPSQNCAGHYGRGLNINLIKQMDEHIYCEATVSQYVPDGKRAMGGVHTLAFGSNFIVADAIHLRKHCEKGSV